MTKEASGIIAVSAEQSALARISKERDLYAGLLELNLDSDPEPFLKSALSLIAGIIGAERGCLELFDSQGDERGWSHATGFSPEEIADVRASLSRGIISEAVATGRAVLTPSALLDPRFRDRQSVQRSKIDSVLCVPIGHDPPRGVLYLQSRQANVFERESVAQVELFAERLAPLVHELERRRRASSPDAASVLRMKLNAADVVGSSRAITAVLRDVELVAPLDVGILLNGETGTGKTQLAHVIHRNSPRAGGPFIELNCAALPDTLISSELFGSLPGAHSTASRRVDGKVFAADGGTLFLDEIGELSLPAQASLLQLLQSKTYFPLGGSKPVLADVRIIAATAIDLQQAAAERRFREDLYYRLQVITIRVPSLSERTEDIALLAKHFCERAHRTLKLPHVELSPGAVRAIEASEWPGNVRELYNAVQRATIRAARLGLRRVEASHVLEEGVGPREASPALTFQEETRRFHAGLVRRALEVEDWNVSAAARRLDLTRTHLYNLIKSFGIKRSD